MDIIIKFSSYPVYDKTSLEFWVSGVRVSSSKPHREEINPVRDGVSNGVKQKLLMHLFKDEAKLIVLI